MGIELTPLKRAGLTARRIAAMTGVPPQTWSRWKLGRIPPNGLAVAFVRVLDHLRENRPDVFEEVVGMLEQESPT